MYYAERKAIRRLETNQRTLTVFSLAGQWMAVSTYRTVPFDLSLICMSLPRVTLMNGRMDSGIRVSIFSRKFVGRGDFSKLRRILLFEMWQQWITQREIQVRCEVKNVYCFKFNSFVNCTLGHSNLS